MCNYSNTNIYITNLFINMIPKYQNPATPLVKINGKWQPLQSQGNGEYTAGNRKFKTNTKPKSALGTKQIVVTPKNTRIEDISKKERRYTSAFNPTDAFEPIHQMFELIGKGVSKVTDATGTTKAVSKLLPWIIPSQYIGWIQTGNHPGTNTGFGDSKQDQYLNEMFDLVATPVTVKGIGKGISLGKQGINQLIRMDMPRYGYKPTTEYYFDPNSVGMNGVKPISSSSQLLYNIKKGKIGLKELSAMVGQAQAKWIMKEKELLLAGRGNQTKLNAILEKAVKGNKGKRGSNTEIDAATTAELATTPKGKLKLIREKYLPQIESSAKETGINWNDQYSVMASMPDELKLSHVGFDSSTPFLERYYKNVVEKVISKNGIQDKLLKSGELRKNSRGQWEGLFNNEYRKVEPTEYIKMRIANNKGYNFDLKALSEGEGTNYPMHGTKTRNYKYLTQPSSSPGKNGYWTGIQDALGLKSRMIDHYKGKGASVPFFRMPDFELPIMKPNGISSSNSYGGSGKSLMDMLLRKPGKIQRPTYVSDPQGTGQPFNEYNFGPTVPNPKSMWNTLDFDPGAGPLAYNIQNNEDNFA